MDLLDVRTYDWILPRTYYCRLVRLTVHRRTYRRTILECLCVRYFALYCMHYVVVALPVFNKQQASQRDYERVKLEAPALVARVLIFLVRLRETSPYLGSFRRRFCFTHALANAAMDSES